MPEQPVVLGLDRRVALARRPDETIQIGDFDMAAAVMNEIRLLQRVGNQGTLLRRAPIICAINSWVNTILSLPERSRVCNRHRASRNSTVCAALQPAVLLNLRVNRQPVARQRCTERRALVSGRAKHVKFHGRSHAGHQYHCAVQRGEGRRGRRISRRCCRVQTIGPKCWTWSPRESSTTGRSRLCAAGRRA